MHLLSVFTCSHLVVLSKGSIILIGAFLIPILAGWTFQIPRELTLALVETLHLSCLEMRTVCSRGCIVVGIIVVEGRVLDKCTDSSRGLVGVIPKGRTLNWLIVEEDRTSGPVNGLLLLVGLSSCLVLLGLTNVQTTGGAHRGGARCWLAMEGVCLGGQARCWLATGGV